MSTTRSVGLTAQKSNVRSRMKENGTVRHVSSRDIWGLRPAADSSPPDHRGRKRRRGAAAAPRGGRPLSSQHRLAAVPVGARLVGTRHRQDTVLVTDPPHDTRVLSIACTSPSNDTIRSGRVHHGSSSRYRSGDNRGSAAAGRSRAPASVTPSRGFLLQSISPLDPALLAALFAPRTAPRPSPGLTPLQRVVLPLRVQMGSSSPQVAAQLGLAIRRVRTIECSGAARAGCGARSYQPGSRCRGK